jgi:eukaryotic-like serine/threonine-protein kinase
LYGPNTDDPEAAPLVTPTEEEMERFLGRQLAAAGEDARRTHAADGAPAYEPEAMTAVPISAKRAAQLAAQKRQPEPEPWTDEDDAPTLVMPRRAEPPADDSPGQAVPDVPTRPRTAARATPAEPPAAAAPPALRQIGRFSGLKRQGRTESGTLYRATDPQLGREVALHLLHGPACDSDKLRPLLMQQLQAAARLSHPNIGVIDEVDVDDGQPFLVSAVIDGETLPQRLQTQGPFSVHDTLELGLQLARALDHAHRHGMLHRDLKPSNVFVLADGKSIQLTGFGLAAPPEAPGEVTVLGPSAGVRQYMTPEQTRGEPQDARSDVFAAGVILYEMLAGERPFRGATLLALATRIANEEPSPLHRVRPDVPPPLRRVVERCLAKAPAQRYASAKDLADALLRVLNDTETTERVVNRPTGMTLGARWAAASGLAAAVLVGAAAAGGAFWQLAAVKAQADDQGRALARFAAAQHAEQALAEDWNAVAAQLLPARQAWGSEHVVVTDAGGIVRASSEPALVGQAYQRTGLAWSPTQPDGTVVRQTGSRLDFDAPIQLQGKTLGRLVIGLPASRMLQAGQSTAWMLGLLAALAAMVAAGVSFLLARRLKQPLAQAEKSLAEIGQGHFNHRVGEERSDEFGQLFAAIDATAQALQRREPGAHRS